MIWCELFHWLCMGHREFLVFLVCIWMCLFRFLQRVQVLLLMQDHVYHPLEMLLVVLRKWMWIMTTCPQIRVFLILLVAIIVITIQVSDFTAGQRPSLEWLLIGFNWLYIYVFTSYSRMITGYGGFYGESDNQGYYVGADAVDLQYPVGLSIWISSLCMWTVVDLVQIWSIQAMHV